MAGGQTWTLALSGPLFPDYKLPLILIELGVIIVIFLSLIHI